MSLRIFVTGATGTVGSAAIRSLLASPDAGSYSVRGLGRSSTAVSTISSLGATPVHGDITDLALLEEEASNADVVIYCAFDHTTGDFVAQAGLEGKGVEAVCKGLSTSGPLPGGGKKILMYCSGVMGFPAAPAIATELTPSPGHYRAGTKVAVDAFASSSPPSGSGIRAVQIRLGGVVHSPAKLHGFLTRMIAGDHVAYFGDGSNTWPAGNAADVGDLLASVVRQRDELKDGITAIHAYSYLLRQKDAAEALGKQLGLPTRPLTDEELEKGGPMGKLIMGNSPGVSNEWTVKTFGWKPHHPTIVEEIEKGTYTKDGKLVA